MFLSCMYVFKVVLPLLIALYLITGTITTELANEQLFLSLTEPSTHQQVLAVRTFVTGGDTSLDFLSERASVHLEDVRQIFFTIRLLFFVSLVALLFLLPFYLKQHSFRKLVQHSFFVSVGINIFAFLALLQFALSFSAIHQFLFEQGSWIFSPNSAIIKLFPFSFFEAFMRHLLTLFFLEALVLGLLWFNLPYFQKIYVKLKQYVVKKYHH